MILFKCLGLPRKLSRLVESQIKRGGYRENNNRIEFIVRREATKADIKAAVEELLDVQVAKVNTKITITGKHASVRLADGYDAEDAALKLGAF